MICSVPTDYDLYLFHEGSHHHSYRVFGAHPVNQDGVSGVRFSVWAPNAREVRVVGDFNRWQGHNHVMTKDQGIWTIFVPGLSEGDIYKYEIHSPTGEVLLKADPYGFAAEARPATASRIACLDSYNWGDAGWQQQKKLRSSYDRPLLIYEVHLGSWRRKDGQFCSYRDLAHELVDYLVDMGYTHVEIMPLMEHPFDGSWGYQITGYYAVTSRYGSPRDFMYFVDQCHQKGIGVILDWVPGHFCKDAHGLRQFDGTPLYESAECLRAENSQWGTLNFDFSKPEVVSYLISNAIFWLDVYHVDGLRVDAVAQMLYLDYGKQGGQWLPNQYGGRENLAAVDFMQRLNRAVFKYFPQALMIAEESTQWPLVTRPTYVGGLGYNYKWNMGWMNDILRYMAMDPVHRKWAHNQLTFSFMYTFSENFILPLSHDEVVHGKKSLLDKMPGDYWQKFANLRALYGYMMAHPGKKLLFMGGEFGQFIEWQYDQSLDWHLLDYDMHRKLHRYTKDLNHFYRQQPALWEHDHDEQGFSWIDPHDYSQSVITFMRKAKSSADFLIVVCNFTPVLRQGYRIGVPQLGSYTEVFNSDGELYGGSGQSNDTMQAGELPWHNQPYSLEIKLPPLATIFIKPKETTVAGS
ncbi:1,4-alpha-glucan branching protein GlgB [Desulfotomaculum nigrificans]|uniref:1,4-alpha-glucan branching protein GlgB n=1 Tax=Desulfotomaculum nigrificans TaxID=1565 RepID=UPI0001FADF2C|nr:1,4-alpha-glucan branching protein GlgB [Desulfotomaculum nigrificans]